jgi:Fe-Mn family superoxide dismutase
MEIKIKFNDTKFQKEDKELIHKFINLLQEKYPLKKSITIKFLGKQLGSMSTGSRTNNGELKVLAKNRLNRDIMRTLAHEWVHEYQMSVQGREQGPNIGGKNEDEANAFAGRLVKMFEKQYPDLEKKLYETKTLSNKISLLEQKLLISEKDQLQKNFINEMKKIGIDKLPYSYSSLKKFIDSKTMDVHYNKHYKGYVEKLNKALSSKDGDMELEEIVKSISKFDNTVRNNAGGAFNHALFWKMLSPKKQIPKGEIYQQIKKDFGNIKKMKDKFNAAAKDRFGSGWAWLYLDNKGKLKIMSLPNQDNPLMNVIKKGGFPLLGLDVWEHAYYLKYQNKRDEYINNFWDVVNWEFVNDLFLTKTKKEKTQLKEEVTENFKKSKTKVEYLCKYSLYRGKENSPFCRLENFVDTINDQYIKNEIEDSVVRLDKFFNKKTVGTFPMIVELSLKDPLQTGNFLKLVSDFIIDDDNEYDNEETKKILRKQKNANKVPENLPNLLAYARYKEHQKHENRFVGKYFKHKKTKLQLNYRCSDDAKEKLIDTLMKIHNNEETLNYHFFRITKCLVDSFKSGSYYLKADLETIEDFLDEDGNVIYPAGSHFEAKKMDPFIDSYLSEFFSIFKESAISDKKPIVGELYNTLVDKIFIWLNKNESAKNYLEKVKSFMSGIIYQDDTIVPTKYIQLYWSNKGQRSCDEKRVSIRFRIDPKYSQIDAYKFIDSDTLESFKLTVPNNEKELVYCPTK